MPRANAAAVETAGELPRLRSLCFTVHGQPVPWARAGRAGGRSYTPKRMKDYQHAIAFAATAARLRDGMVSRFVGRQAWPLDALYRIELAVYAATSRPLDLDNCIKQLGDACQSHGESPGVLWANDSQIVECAGIKRIDRENPRIDVRVWILDSATTEGKQ